MSAGWQPLLSALATEPAPAWMAMLVERYAEPHRRYHGVAHIEALARLFAEVAAGPGWARPAEVALAILFHDAIYVPGRADNERQSAELARECHGAVSECDIERVVELILATADHGSVASETIERDLDLGRFLDADVAILGASPEVYDRYARGVLEEYAPVVDARHYRVARRAFLQAQAARPSLFHTQWFRDRYEAQARANLARELGELTIDDEQARE